MQETELEVRMTKIADAIEGIKVAIKEIENDLKAMNKANKDFLEELNNQKLECSSHRKDYATSLTRLDSDVKRSKEIDEGLSKSLAHLSKLVWGLLLGAFTTILGAIIFLILNK